MAALSCAVPEILWLEKRCSFVISARFLATLADTTNFLEHFYVVFSDDIYKSGRKVIETEYVIFKK